MLCDPVSPHYSIKYYTVTQVLMFLSKCTRLIIINNNTFNLEAPFKTPKVTLQSI